MNLPSCSRYRVTVSEKIFSERINFKIKSINLENHYRPRLLVVLISNNMAKYPPTIDTREYPTEQKNLKWPRASNPNQPGHIPPPSNKPQFLSQFNIPNILNASKWFEKVSHGFSHRKNWFTPLPHLRHHLSHQAIHSVPDAQAKGQHDSRPAKGRFFKFPGIDADCQDAEYDADDFGEHVIISFQFLIDRIIRSQKKKIYPLFSRDQPTLSGSR